MDHENPRKRKVATPIVKFYRKISGGPNLKINLTILVKCDATNSQF